MTKDKEDLLYFAEVIARASSLIIVTGGKKIGLGGDLIEDICAGLKLLAEKVDENRKPKDLQ